MAKQFKAGELNEPIVHDSRYVFMIGDVLAVSMRSLHRNSAE